MEAPTLKGMKMVQILFLCINFLQCEGREAPTTQGQKVAPYLKYNKVKILIVPFE